MQQAVATACISSVRSQFPLESSCSPSWQGHCALPSSSSAAAGCQCQTSCSAGCIRGCPGRVCWKDEQKKDSCDPRPHSNLWHRLQKGKAWKFKTSALIRIFRASSRWSIALGSRRGWVLTPALPMPGWLNLGKSLHPPPHTPSASVPSPTTLNQMLWGLVSKF